jgi:hypothetical protein
MVMYRVTLSTEKGVSGERALPGLQGYMDSWYASCQQVTRYQVMALSEESTVCRVHRKLAVDASQRS